MSGWIKASNSRAPSDMTNIATGILYRENNVTDFLPMTDSAVRARKYTQFREENGLLIKLGHRNIWEKS